MSFWALLGATLAIEIPLVLVTTRGSDPPVAAVSVGWVALAVNLISFTSGWAAVHYRPASWIGTELGIVIFEAWGYARFAGLSWRRAATVSVLANGATIALAFGVGLGG